MLFLLAGLFSLLTFIIWMLRKKFLRLKIVAWITAFLAIQILILIVASPLIIDSYLHSETHFAPYPEIDTIFATGFTKEKFEQVQIGISMSEVESLLGEPLLTYRWENGYENCHVYS